MDNKKELIFKILSFLFSVIIIAGIIKVSYDNIESLITGFFFAGILILLLGSLPLFILNILLLFIMYYISEFTYKFIIIQKLSSCKISKKQWIVILITVQILILAYFIPIVIQNIEDTQDGREGLATLFFMSIVDFGFIYLIYLFSKFIYKITLIIRGKNNE